MRQIDKVRHEMVLIAKLGSALSVLGWDQEVNLPPKGQAIRGEVSSLLAADVHRRATAPEFVNQLASLAKPAAIKKLSPDDQVIVRESWRDIQRAKKLPTEFVEEFTKLTSTAFAAWTEARQKSDFSIFKPYLKKIIAMNRRQADYYGYEGSPYDALLDGYEPEMTVKKLDELLIPLAKELSGLISQLDHKKPAVLPKQNYPISAQQHLNEHISRAIGYDLDAGRIDASPHPFTINFHPTDVRITTRYAENDFWVSLGSVIHEVGHALYEQGLPAKHFGTPLGESVSLGVHESQSRIWENFVGRSQAFVDYLYPLLKQQFGPLSYSAIDLYKRLNRVNPSLIRVESDEVTYNLHIIVRYELEKALIENRLKVDELPAAWNEKMKQYLGVKVPNDRQGVLQDIHWSHGTFGYFPTYTLGNLYAAQLFDKISSDIPGLESKFAKGDFKPFLKWLRKNIHQQGRRHKPEELISRITGKPLDSSYLLAHLKTKIDLQLG